LLALLLCFLGPWGAIAVGASAAEPVRNDQLPIAPGPFQPIKLGYKDLIPLWKAEKWDPDRLMALYKKAGARYFVSMGVHHDNFDLWNSTHHKWNAVKLGPHRDVVGD